ncbi:hypothetical protein [Sediminibacterium soli]|uniref:hypothetical protein n=1 Tax=Sediminibacterium soli TaxID=2698829 RepID=UPI00137A2F09|nr:hypothetical protein [Sediminibacterium soli]NCI45063.1 hypothetical protein [Sediminibacterium soli]
MTRVIPAVLLILFFQPLLNAQKSMPVNERWVFFPYVTGERISDKKIKVMVIAKNIFRFDLLDQAIGIDEAPIFLDFRQLIEPINRDEREFSADYDNVMLGSPVIEDLGGGFLRWNATTVRENDLQSSDNTLSAIEKIRTNLINRYKREGYKIYQVDFTPNTGIENGSGYAYYDPSKSKHIPFSYEKLLPLSPLYVPVYRKGEIKDMLSALAPSSKSSSGFSGLVIESKEPKKETKNKSSNSGSGGLTEEQIQRNIAYHQVIARSIEAEGDKLYAAGESNYRDALAKYEAAQRESYSYDVQAKIDHIKSATWVGMADAGTALATSLQNIAESTDPHEKTKAGFMLFNYAGLSGGYTKLMNPSLQKPVDIYLSVIVHRIFLSWEIRVGYTESPIYEYTIQRYQSATPYKVQIQNTCLMAGGSVGLNIPLKPLVLNAMYGIDLVDGISTGRKLLTNDFTLKDLDMIPLWRTKTTFGATLNIPKTKLSIGVQYHLYSINGKDYTKNKEGHEITYNKDPSGKYYYGKTTNDEYKFSNLGVSIGWTL